MSDIAIRVENLSKRYEIGRAGTRHDTLRDALAGLFRGEDRGRSEAFWALRDVSFEVKRGEVVGIIGRNGAGKSTLLKVLSQITEPTGGRAEIHGRVGSLLEVGTGFHPELTGRENIYLNGAILGMRREEIARKFDEIVAFSEIEKFLDTPVKRYSSGMYVRLAFAVAAHLEPEILLVDEVLAVGDAAFQKKALGKMGDVVNEGRTVLFVSHNMAAIRSLTSRALCIQRGEVAIDATSGVAIEQYLYELQTSTAGAITSIDYYRRELMQDTPIKTKDIKILGNSNDEIAVISMGEPYEICLWLHATQQIDGANLTITLRNSRDERVATIFSWDYGVEISVSPGDHTVIAKICDLSLPPGAYYVDVGINQNTQTRAYDVISGFPLCRVVSVNEIHYWPDRPWGAVHVSNVIWRINARNTP